MMNNYFFTLIQFLIYMSVLRLSLLYLVMMFMLWLLFLLCFLLAFLFLLLLIFLFNVHNLSLRDLDFALFLFETFRLRIMLWLMSLTILFFGLLMKRVLLLSRSFMLFMLLMLFWFLRCLMRVIYQILSFRVLWMLMLELVIFIRLMMSFRLGLWVLLLVWLGLMLLMMDLFMMNFNRRLLILVWLFMMLNLLMMDCFFMLMLFFNVFWHTYLNISRNTRRLWLRLIQLSLDKLWFLLNNNLMLNLSWMLLLAFLLFLMLSQVWLKLNFCGRYNILSCTFSGLIFSLVLLFPRSLLSWEWRLYLGLQIVGMMYVLSSLATVFYMIKWVVYGHNLQLIDII